MKGGDNSMPTLGNCAGVGVEIRNCRHHWALVVLPTSPRSSSVLVVGRNCERVGFAEKSSQAWGGVGIRFRTWTVTPRVPAISPHVTAGSLQTQRVSVRVDLPVLMEQGAVPTRSGNARFSVFNHSTNPARNVGPRIKIKYD